MAERETHLVDKAVARGFMLSVVQGRNLHFPTKEPRDGRHHDFYFRDLRSPSKNPDIASADRLIDDIVQEGKVDPKRIYAMGWSNGAFFAQLYAIARHETATPGGARIAASAVFSAAAPFDDITVNPYDDRDWTGAARCRLARPPVSNVPILMLYRTRDAAVPCGASDRACLGGEPGYQTSALAVSDGRVPRCGKGLVSESKAITITLECGHLASRRKRPCRSFVSWVWARLRS